MKRALTMMKPNKRAIPIAAMLALAMAAILAMVLAASVFLAGCVREGGKALGLGDEEGRDVAMRSPVLAEEIQAAPPSRRADGYHALASP
jgi:hypothetical protein